MNGTYTPEDGESADTHTSACAKISDDVTEIDLSTICGESIGSWEPIGKKPIGYFGQFDGNHKTIKNLYINATDDIQGFFGGIIQEEEKEEAWVKNIYFENASVSCANNTENIGVLAGTIMDASISGIHILSGTVNGYDAVGGLVGIEYRSKIYDCTNHAKVYGNRTAIGGMVGHTYEGTIEKCANYGAVEAEVFHAGGIVGYGIDTHIKNCANLGHIKAGEAAGGLAGTLRTHDTDPILQNVYTLGDVEAESQLAGLVCGEAERTKLMGHVLYNTSALLNNQANNAQAFHISPEDGNQVTGLSLENFKNGYAAYLLQQGAGEDGVWGQQLGIDEYPKLGSTHTVYADNVTSSCTGVISQGIFTNEQPAAGNQLTLTHGSITYHPAVAMTCIADGNVAYYECPDCHKRYSDEQLTQQLNATKVSTHGHEYADGKCSRCQKLIPMLTEGTHTIQIEAVQEKRHNPSSYNLYQYIATSNGTLTVFTTGEADTYGALWNSELTEELRYEDQGGEKNNFQFTYEVEKGNTYYIGVRDYNGELIPGDYLLTIKMDAEDGAEVLVGTLDDKDIIGTKQGDAIIVEHLDLADGKQMMLLKDNVQLQGGTYTRTFQNDKWQPLYVPFELEVTEELLNDFELAAPNNLHEYELSDGSTKVSLEAKKMKSGHTIKALRPYLIRAKEAGEKTIQLANSPLKAATEDTYVSCSSVLRLYKFIGTLKGKTSFDPSADFVLSEGLLHPADANAQLKPMRWYLNATDSGTDMGINSGSDGDTSAFSRSIDITILDGDATTGIDDLHVITEQSSGFENVARPGIYDLQGRKLSQEPQSGVYIKDGKKVVK